ncbi:exonuclease SbcC [Lactobacillus sp. Sy-1]|uniref:exonuclease SbcC n=1 Tax=Lactobacillus sp. Sy-1 TaxID=2109645 RepID=UPI001C578D48|nr:exonuclease SbcC [Lactobacillus sp. Sy-1]MBW1605652.1 exonuclease SbcC [Lactobacillus sp. Sy-1]
MNNDRDNRATELSVSLNAKIDHLNALRDALNHGDDLAIYKLINAKHFNEIMQPAEPVDDKYDVSLLVKDLQSELSHYLSEGLINYLGQNYPFFYYNEYQFGHFRIFFGNWWDHKLFGELDVLNVKFEFNEVELDKLGRSFELEAENKTFYSDEIMSITDKSQEIQSLIDEKDERDAMKADLKVAIRENESGITMPWDAARVKAEHTQLTNQYKHLVAEDEAASEGAKQIKQNEARILELNKEDTIISYEKQSIRDCFQNFNNFMDTQSGLYADYMQSLGGDNHEG